MISIQFEYISLIFTDDQVSVSDKSQANVVKFIDELNRVNWCQLDGFHDPNCAYGSFSKEYSELYNTCTPLKKVKANHHLKSEPWLTRGLPKSIKTKSKLYENYLLNPSPENDTLYKHFKNKLESVKSNIKSTWRILNEKKKKKVKLNSTFRDGTQDISDPVEIANKFWNYFTNIGPNLAREIEAITALHLKF